MSRDMQVRFLQEALMNSHTCDNCEHEAQIVNEEVLEKNYKECPKCKVKTIKKQIDILGDMGEMFIQIGRQCTNESCNECGTLYPENKDWAKVKGRDGKFFN